MTTALVRHALRRNELGARHYAFLAWGVPIALVIFMVASTLIVPRLYARMPIVVDRAPPRHHHHVPAAYHQVPAWTMRYPAPACAR